MCYLRPSACSRFVDVESIYIAKPLTLVGRAPVVLTCRISYQTYPTRKCIISVT